MSEARLGDLLEVLIDHRGKTPKKLGGEFVGAGVPVASAVNVKGGRLDLGDEPRYVTTSMYKQWMPVPVTRGDVLLTSEAPLGEVARVPFAGPLVLGQRLFGLRGRQGILDTGYLFYLLQWSPVRNQLEARSTGTTVHGIRQSELVEVRVPLRPFAKQRAIADMLGAFDDKIEANRIVMETSWSFAEANFLNVAANDDTEHVPLGQVAQLKYGKSLPERSREPGSVPVFGSGGVVAYHRSRLVTGPGIIVGRKGTAGAVHWSHSDFFPIDTTFYVESEGVPMEFLYFALRSLGLDQMNFDSAVPGLNRNAALARLISMPNREALETFTELVRPLINLVAAIDRESRVLATLREALLPKLLSGEMSVRDAETTVG